MIGSHCNFLYSARVWEAEARRTESAQDKNLALNLAVRQGDFVVVVRDAAGFSQPVTEGGGSRIGSIASRQTENAMLGILLPFSAVFAACTPTQQDAVMRSPSPFPRAPVRVSSDTGSEVYDSLSPSQAMQNASHHAQAMQGPIPRAVSAAENPGTVMLKDLPAEAIGRRTLSTAFVMVGPDGHLTVELRNGLVLVLREVVMRPKDYCGRQVQSELRGKRYCGGYADVVAARPGGVSG